MSRFEVISEVTGTVWKVEAQVGQAVGDDDVILIVESMKMEIPITSMDSGTVVEVLVSQGDVVSEGQHVATIER
ncbi:acetyl-CoA carboxylase biotin carboxyl carrier protein subunit [Paralcaligenes sp. KSB-10]|uniref:acetyl-CoA carboxylase biotin carboxyl carrier protein subunit n=1 Tax=Paralcaligenes sp. KSB-10 TaxID=2901142 RepID=UPI001E53A4BD|nr:acetyl-CoA carboxylase biotin carboxyl carrier protein subunit [Paralcaligenes sp. KSB-10]UHL63146.1 acetyl-CoA carboxylase biotin carboxyl carrier protein subunit [Paralcaligenes sp. KSB-10]